MSVNIILIAIISIISIIAFNRAEIMARYQLNAWSVFHRKEYVRMISHGFLHADWSHLLINMFVLFSFGQAVLFYFDYFFTDYTEIRFLLLFLTAIPVSAIYSVIKNKSNHWYNAVGASGAVSAVVFASIFFDPYNPILLFGIIPIPGIIFGILYLYYSARMARQQADNIGHDAHFWGAVYGFVFPLLYDPSLIFRFFDQIMTFKVFG
jgi:membrane associated rhomboid family serine protease